MSLGRWAVVAAALGLFLIACDGPQYLNVDNQSQATYVAISGDGHHVVIPPNLKINVAVIPFAGTPVTPTAPVKLFDSECKSLGTFDQAGTIVVTSGGKISYRSEYPSRGEVGADAPLWC